MNFPLLVLVGPTAAGKSAWALEIASLLQAEIVSADSLQVYRHFNIGTGKIDPQEQCGIKHHLIDVIDPDESFSVARFVKMADSAIEEIQHRGRRVIVVGGTGLYVRALLRGLFETPPADPEIRSAHKRIWEEQGGDTLYQMLSQIDPTAAARIYPQDFIRISRALEVFQQTGITISELQQRHGFASWRYPALVLGISPDRPVLRDRIEKRVDQMMARGFLEEVRHLIEQGYGTCQPMGSLGYRQLRTHLQGNMDLAEAVRQTKRDTWRFARRQLNWFSSEPDVHWTKDPRDLSLETIMTLTQQSLHGMKEKDP